MRPSTHQVPALSADMLTEQTAAGIEQYGTNTVLFWIVGRSRMGGKGSAHGQPWNPYIQGSGAYKGCEHAPFSINVDFALVGKQMSCPRVSHAKLPRVLINLGYEFWASDNWKNLVLDQHLQSSLPLKPAVFSFSGGENDSCFLLPLCLLNYFL